MVLRNRPTTKKVHFHLQINIAKYFAPNCVANVSIIVPLYHTNYPFMLEKQTSIYWVQIVYMYGTIGLP